MLIPSPNLVHIAHVLHVGQLVGLQVHSDMAGCCLRPPTVQVERFKYRQSWDNALHARFDYMTGDHVTDDESWGHLQVSMGCGLVCKGPCSAVFELDM